MNTSAKPKPALDQPLLDQPLLDQPLLDLPSVGDSLAADLRIALMRAVRRLRAERADAELSDGHYSVLAYLDRNGPSTPRQLATFERVQPPSMTRTIAALVDGGFAVRTDHPRDGRQVLVSLTVTGRRTVQETRRRRDGWLTRRLADLDPGDRAVLSTATDILRRIADS
jgi:DNA-binding MarR family transcriptional regulator